MKKSNKGFTIVELVIVIAVIAILAAVLIPTFSGVVNKANESARTQEMTNALKVVLAGNAQTGALAENTVFVTGDGYYAVYNGNKLGEITTIAKSDEEYNLEVAVSGDTGNKAATITKLDGQARTGTAVITVKSVILPYDGTAFDTNSLKQLGKLFGLEDAAASALAVSKESNSTKNIVTVNEVTLTVYSNVDLAKGMFVLSPTA